MMMTMMMMMMILRMLIEKVMKTKSRECEIKEVEKCVEVEEEKCQEVIVIIFIKIFGKPSSSKLESKCITNVIPGGRGGAGLQDGRARAVSEHCRGTVPAGGQLSLAWVCSSCKFHWVVKPFPQTGANQ